MHLLPRNMSISLLSVALMGFSACANTSASKGGVPVASAQQVEVTNEGGDERALAPRGRPLALWQVARAGQPDSYLFGTCHAGVSIEEALPAEMGVLLTEASRFVMEVDPATMDPAAMQARLMLPDGQQLSELVGADLWSTLVTKFELGPAAEAFDRMHPFALLGYLVSNLANDMAQRESKVPMDFTLSRMAADADVDQAFLETVDQQLDLFLNWPMDEMIEGLAELTQPGALDEMKAELNAVLEVCRSGDETGLMALRAAPDDSDWEQRLLTERNQQWIPKLEAFFAEGSTFVAAGAAHMFGDQSVVELLQARGFTVKRMAGVTSPRSAAVAPPEATDGDTLPLSFLTSQVEAQASSTLCAQNMVPVQCHGVTPEKCRGILTQAIAQCASDLALPSELSQEDMMGTVQRLGPCVVPQFQKLLPPEQAVRSEGCSEAYETLQ